jgi:hypothetical protein
MQVVFQMDILDISGNRNAAFLLSVIPLFVQNRNAVVRPLAFRFFRAIGSHRKGA